tara:strand:- start:1042 stop:2247 length:1206 start_codon:yes stop_codon:yes gene_type:complete
MIVKNFNLTNTDIRLTNNHEIINGDNVDYKNKVCIKPWGYEFLSYQSNKIGIWILSINKNTGTSIHTHFNKDTILLVLNGKIKLETADSYDFINPNEYCFIPKKKFHGIFAVSENALIMEIEIYNNNVTFSDKNDLLRLIDKYKRSKIGYESSVKVITENLEDYDYFYIDSKFKKNIFNTSIVSNNYNKLNKNDNYIILLDGEIVLNNYILKEGSIIKCSDLNSCDLTNQTFLQINTDSDYQNKIISNEEELELIVNTLKDKNNKIVLTCGCFDILHTGHLHILKESKKFGDKLIVCLSSDEQIKLLKGENRPINHLDDRLKLFSVIPYVDYVYVYNENLDNDNEEELDKIMNLIIPNIWTKGCDYTVDGILKKHPSLNKIEIIKRIEGKSTTNIIKKISI